MELAQLLVGADADTEAEVDFTVASKRDSGDLRG